MLRRTDRPALPAIPSDHWDGKRFFNPHADTDKRLGDVLKLYKAMRGNRWPAPAPQPPLVPPAAGGDDGTVAVTYVGHATMLVRVGGAAFLTDPVFSAKAGPFGRLGPRRVREPAVRLEDLPPVDAVLVSHNHYDHLCTGSLAALARRHGVPQAMTGLGNGPLLRRSGFEAVEELDWWDSVAGPNGSRITFVPAQHWSARTPFDRRRTLWGGFVVEAAGSTVYFAGDTGYCPHFKEIRERFGPIDVALLPIGAYEPRWFMKSQHMNPADAVRAHCDLEARQSVAIHFGTFQLTTEAIDAPQAALRLAKAEHSIDPHRFIVPGFGETLRFGGQRADAA